MSQPSVSVDEMLHRTRTWCGLIRLVEWNDGTVFTLDALRRAHHYHAMACEGCGKECRDRASRTPTVATP